ncbi:Golgi phosphoprotein 3-domain-containing protein [Roridomyces roridus]|uniref:Golgi phosphoprotein 3-domain-containing protein n=1 Tax=Roridomyces roridus TaxID=1738132 RepID=A0AAD7FD95_9AGAR|nr:Golgi phosphoprotein 3-domain-containing protein [Roridomyces roridus]
MASAGLSRRRAPQASVSTGDDDDDRPRATLSTTTNSSSPPSPSPEANGAGSHAGSAFAGGARVAYDPRDLPSSDDTEGTGGSVPKLTLMEEVLLLGIKDKQGYLSFWNDNISYALRGCILIELALRRRIGIVRDPGRKRLPLPERMVTVLSTRQTGETLLDETLKMMKQTEDAGEKMGVGTWIDLLSATVPLLITTTFPLPSFVENDADTTLLQARHECPEDRIPAEAISSLCGRLGGRGGRPDVFCVFGGAGSVSRLTGATMSFVDAGEPLPMPPCSRFGVWAPWVQSRVGALGEDEVPSAIGRGGSWVPLQLLMSDGDPAQGMGPLSFHLVLLASVPLTSLPFPCLSPPPTFGFRH